MEKTPLCGTCEQRPVMTAFGNAKECGHRVNNLSYKFCLQCAIQHHVCAFCGISLTKSNQENPPNQTKNQ